MRLFEEAEEHERLVRELGDLFDDTGSPQGLVELGFDHDGQHFHGRKIA
ncbi:hypothetical protein AB0H73_18590 [Streptomyces olivoreticuli]